MIKRTIYITSPARLSMRMNQMIVQTGSRTEGSEETREVPIEDLGILLLEHPQITLTHVLIDTLLENNCVVITCNKKFMPSGIILPFEGNTLLADRYKAQIEASEPLKKNLWQQVIKTKILNQAAVLKSFGIDEIPLRTLAAEVNSGDTRNCEGVAAKYYWDHIFRDFVVTFRRERKGEEPNNALNFTYAILRSTVARALVGSGLLPALGLHHRNKYNAYCLADDMMEPYRPYADRIILNMMRMGTDFSELSKQLKAELLGIATVDVYIGDETSPLMIATQRTSASLVQCLGGKLRKLVLPVLQ